MGAVYDDVFGNIWHEDNGRAVLVGKSLKYKEEFENLAKQQGMTFVEHSSKESSDDLPIIDNVFYDRWDNCGADGPWGEECGCYAHCCGNNVRRWVTPRKESIIEKVRRYAPLTIGIAASIGILACISFSKKNHH